MHACGCSHVGGSSDSTVVASAAATRTLQHQLGHWHQKLQLERPLVFWSSSSIGRLPASAAAARRRQFDALIPAHQIEEKISMLTLKIMPLGVGSRR